MTDAVVGVGVGGQVTLVITKQGLGTVYLDEGETLGRMQPVTLVESSETTRALDHDLEINTHVAAIEAEEKEREERLLVALSFDCTELPSTERNKLRKLVIAFANNFTLTWMDDSDRTQH